MNETLQEKTMSGGKNMDVFNELVKRDPGLLSKPIDELAPISFVGQSAVTAYRELIRRIDSLPLTEEQKAQTLRDGQEAGKMLLAIEARIGELLPTAEEAIATNRGERQRHGRFSTSLPDGIDKNKAHTARTIANNPEAVRAVIEEAEANDDIPTKTAVVNRVKAQKAEERAERYKEASERARANIEQTVDRAPIAVQQYISKLNQALLVLPTEPPKDGWNEETLRVATGSASVIVKRLARFLDDETVQFAETTMERLGFEEVV